MSNKPKYNLNDVLAPILDDTGLVKLHVVEIMTITGKTSNAKLYHCRVYTTNFKGGAPVLSKDLIRFSEAELKLYKEPKEL